VKANLDLQEEERQRLVAKKNQYAKYVKDFIKPQIKPKSQDNKLLKDLQSMLELMLKMAIIH
jgi:hypothetical protein